MDSSPILVDSCGILTFLQECEGHQEVLIWEKVAKGPGIFESSKILVPKVDHLQVFEGPIGKSELLKVLQVFLMMDAGFRVEQNSILM